MQSKMERIAVSKRSDFQTADFSKDTKIKMLDRLKDEKSKLDDFHQQIFPWVQCYSSTHKKYYFHNPDTSQSQWSLPQNLQRSANGFFHLQSVDLNDSMKKNYELFLKHNQIHGNMEVFAKDDEHDDEKNKESINSKDDKASINSKDEKESIHSKENESELNQNLAHDLIGNNDNETNQPQSQTNQEMHKIEHDSPQTETLIQQTPIIEHIQLKNFKKDWKSRGAPVQWDPSFAQDTAYRERDQDYNIWYDKYIEDEIVLQREGAKTKCNPITQSGYTRADTYDRGHRNFCIHFARGNCYLGVTCGFYHHIPTVAECLDVDNGKDIFGRSRYATHRKDNQGIGNFMKETRTLRISDFCTPTQLKNAVEGAYEMIWRHFSLWGDIEDMFLLPSTNIAFIRYAHRCMAEFAKLAMTDQPLDADEILTVKWTNDDCFNLDEAEGQELEESRNQQKIKQLKDDKKKSKHKLLTASNDANREEDNGEREVKVTRNKLTMDEFYREEELNWNYKKQREKLAENQAVSIKAPFNLFEQKLKEGESGKVKLDGLLKGRNEARKGPGFNVAEFLKEKEENAN